MENRYKEICKAFNLGCWSADYATRQIITDDVLKQLLKLPSNKFSFDEFLDCVICEERIGVKAILDAFPSTPIPNCRITLKLRRRIYFSEIVFEKESKTDLDDNLVHGCIRLEAENEDTEIFHMMCSAEKPSYVHSENVHSELREHNIRTGMQCKIGAIFPLTWCLYRHCIIVGIVENDIHVKKEFPLDVFRATIHADDIDKFNAELNSFSDGKEDVLQFIFRSTCLSDDYTWHELIGKRLRCDKNIQHIKCVGLLHNIDKTKKNTDELESNRDLLKNICSNIPVGIGLFDKNGSLLNINHKMCEIFGMEDVKKFVGSSIFAYPFLPDEFKKQLQLGMAVDTSIKYDFSKANDYFTSSRKGKITLLTRGTPLYDANNEISNYLLVHVDNTKNLLTLNRINDLENFYSVVTRFAQVGYSKYNLCTKRGVAIDQWYKNMGEIPHTQLSHIIGNYEHLHPEDRVTILNCDEKMLRGEINSFKHELRVCLGNDKYQWVNYSAIVTKYDPALDEVIVASVNIDITEQKETELLLTKARKKAENSDYERRIVLDNLYVGLIYINKDFVVQWGSAKMVTERCYTPGELCYKTNFNRDTPCEKCALKEMFSSRKKEIDRYETNGGILEYTANPVYDQHGEFMGGVLIIEDITTRVNQERKISEFNQLMNAILTYIPMHLYVKRAADDFKYLYWNDVMAIEPNLHQEDVIGKTDFDFLSLENAKQVRANDLRLIEKNQKKINSIDSYVNSAGETRIIQSTRVLIPSEDELPWILGVAWDITDIKKTETELIKAKEAAEKSNLIKSAFLANMSHEIRTPLNAIMGFSELLFDKNIADEERKEYITIIQRNNTLLLHLISDVLDLSKIEARALDFNYDRINLNLLCNSVVVASNLKSESDVPVVMESGMKDYYIYSDENRVHQMISNLVNNALKFTKKGVITVGYRLLNERKIEIYVEDTGSGIPADKLDTIFDRFVKLNSFVQGTGLGLAICKSLAEQLNGHIGVKSVVGVGSRFWITLPYNKEV